MRPSKNRKRSVGIFVSVWHDHPSAQRKQVQGKVGSYTYPEFYWWGEPSFGIDRYTWRNTEMIDYHVNNWITLGVDFIFLDFTNGTQEEILQGADRLCARMAETGRGPRIVMWIRSVGDAKLFWDRYYKKYPKDLFFNHRGKPLLLIAGTTDGFPANSATPKPIPSGGILDNFTVRWMWALMSDAGTMWKYKENSVTPKPYMFNGRPEQMGVTFAVQKTFMTTTNDGRRCRDDGKFFADQVRNMKKYNPDIVTIGSYNEWISQQQNPTGGAPKFTDLWLPECSADIEPMKGGFGAKYFNMAKDFIRSYAPGAYK